MYNGRYSIRQTTEKINMATNTITICHDLEFDTIGLILNDDEQHAQMDQICDDLDLDDHMEDVDKMKEIVTNSTALTQLVGEFDVEFEVNR